MISKKYSAQFKIEKVKEYLEEHDKTKISKAAYSSKIGVSDSTFNDWVLKYERDQVGFCNITNEIVKLNEIETINAEDYIIRPVTANEEFVTDENYLRLHYNGAIIEFNKNILDRVMEILKGW